MPVEAHALPGPMSHLLGLIEELQGQFPAAAAGDGPHKG
jgi:hypothetical protein